VLREDDRGSEGPQETLSTDIRRGEHRALSTVTFVEYAVSWIETYRGRTSRGCGEGTREDYRGALEREAIPFFGRIHLAEIELRDLKEFVAYLEKPQPLRADHPRARGLALSSVRKTVAPVKAMLSTAVEDGLLRHSPAAELRIVVDSTSEVEDADDVKALTEGSYGSSSRRPRSIPIRSTRRYRRRGGHSSSSSHRRARGSGRRSSSAGVTSTAAG
jgi:hypothetical protein